MKNKAHWLSFYWRKSDIEIYIFFKCKKNVKYKFGAQSQKM